MKNMTMMSIGMAVALLCGPATHTSAPAAAAASSAVGVIGDYYKMVRAEYSGIPNDFGTTDIFITNHYANQPITMGNVYILGRSGTSSVIATQTSMSGLTIPPLGVIRIPIDNTISGVTPESSWNGLGVRNVVVGWTGPEDAASVTAVVRKRTSGGSSYSQSHIVHEGVPLLWQQ